MEVLSLIYMMHVTFEHQEHDFIEIHSPTTAVADSYIVAI